MGHQTEYGEPQCCDLRPALLCYHRTESNDLIIVEEEAAIVRRIFSMYIKGASVVGIKRALEGDGIKTPSGRDTWAVLTIQKILRKPDIFDLRQRHSRPDARKPLESANLLAPGAFSFWACPPCCAGTTCFAEADFLLP